MYLHSMWKGAQAPPKCCGRNFKADCTSPKLTCYKNCTLLLTSLSNIIRKKVVRARIRLKESTFSAIKIFLTAQISQAIFGSTTKIYPSYSYKNLNYFLNIFELNLA